MANLIQLLKDRYLNNKKYFNPDFRGSASNTYQNLKSEVQSGAKNIQTSVGNFPSKYVFPALRQLKENYQKTPQQRADAIRPYLAKSFTETKTPELFNKVESFANDLPNRFEQRFQEGENKLPPALRPLLIPTKIGGRVASNIPKLTLSAFTSSPEVRQEIEHVRQYGTEQQKAQLQLKLLNEMTESIAFGTTSAPSTKLNNMSFVKNMADNSDSLSTFVKRIRQSPEAAKTIKEAGFNSVKEYWKHTHEGFNKLNKLMTESPAQTKFRQESKSLYDKGRDFVQEMESEVFKPNGNVNLTPKQKVNILDYMRTPDRVLQKMGLGNEAKMIRNSWDKYLAELPQEVNRVTEWSQRVDRPEGNQLIFKYLDGQVSDKVLLPNELQVATEIKSYLKEWAVKLKLPEEHRLTNYITHIFDNDIKGGAFPDEIASLIRDKVAGSVYDPFTTKRLGQRGYVEDTWRALDAYVKRATRKVNMDDVLSRVSMKTVNFEDSQYRFVKSYIDRVNLRPTDIDKGIDNLIQSTGIGFKLGDRPTASITRKARQWVSRGLLGLNPATALKNLSQGANTYAELGEKYTVTGYSKAIRELPDFLAGKETELERVGVLRDNFIQDRTLNATKKFWEKLDKGLYYMFEIAEKMNRGAAYYGGKARALSQGKTMDEAIQAGIDVARKTQFTFGSVDTPVALQSDIAKTMTQFLSYTVKQTEFLGEKVLAKDLAGLVRYTASFMAFAYTIGQAFGMDWKDIIPTVRIGAPPTLQAPYGALQVLSGAKDKYGQEADPNLITRALENKNLTKGLVSYIPAGNQLKKSLEGIISYTKGESLTPTGRTRFQVEQNPVNLLKSAVFGQYSTSEGQKYVENLGVSKGEQLFRQFKQLPPEEAARRAAILKKKDPQAYKSLVQFGIDRRLTIKTNEKNIRSLPIKDGSRSKAIIRLMNSKRTPQQKADTYRRLKQLGIITPDIEKQLNAARKAGAFR